MDKPKCKICRRLNEKLFLKGERCFTSKCAIVKRNYPPGQKGKRRRGRPSEYAVELREKQKLKNWYNLKEKQFKNYVEKVLEEKGGLENAPVRLIQMLECRLDNAVFRLGFTLSRSKARQLVSHGHFLVNGRATDIPSYQLKKGDVVSLKPQKREKKIAEDIRELLNKKDRNPDWLQLNKEKLEGKVVGLPTLEDVSPPVEISSIFEFYSR